MYRVLLVDDDACIQDANQAYLRSAGYEVYRADNGADALKIAGTAALDAMVVDVDMPGMDGVTVCRRLREVSQVPVIFLSAYAKTDDRIRGLLAGGDDYLAKPYSLVELELRLACASSGIITSRPARYSGLATWKLIWACGKSGIGEKLPGLPRWNLIFWPSWHRTPTRFFPMSSSMTGFVRLL